MKKTAGKLETLQKDLAQFGLNPKEWELIPREKPLFIIQNREDPEFILAGQVKRQPDSVLRWQRLELLRV